MSCNSFSSDIISSSNLNQNTVVTPNCNDVLCGRGSGVNTFSGNIFFRELVRVRKDLYRRVKRHQKIPIAEEIIDAITSLDPPGRFLIRSKEGKDDNANSESSGGCWHVHSRKQSMVKTAQALREGATKRERLIVSCASVGSSSSTTNNSSSQQSQQQQQHQQQHLGRSYSCGMSSSDGEEQLEDHYHYPLPDDSMVTVVSPPPVLQSMYPYSNRTEQVYIDPNNSRALLLQRSFLTAPATKVQIPPLPNHHHHHYRVMAPQYGSGSHLQNDDNDGGRFDDPEEGEQMDTSLQVFVAAIQMRRRMLADGCRW